MKISNVALAVLCLAGVIGLSGCSQEDIEDFFNPPENCKVLFIELPVLCDYD